MTKMQEKLTSLFRPTCENRFGCYRSEEEAKKAKLRNKQISKILKQHQKEELKKLKILLLGTAESGKSTITKQMKIIHGNGFDMSERLGKISDIRRNIQQSIVVLLSAMDKLHIPLEDISNTISRDFILREAANPTSHRQNEFLDHAERLWADAGVQACYKRSHEFQLIDCAKYFLDKIHEIKNPAYIPSDQDILRCRSLTTAIQHTEFEVPDGGHQVKFDVYDVGGQQGERKKWIQVFDSVTAILFVVDCSSFDQTLREDPSKNRLLEALENFEQVWNNRFLKYVSVLLFINKIDVLAEKIARGRVISELTKLYPDVFPDFETFTPSKSDILEFLEAYPSYSNETNKKSKSVSHLDAHPDTIKTAVYIKQLFMKIVRGELQLKQRVTKQTLDWHDGHSCEYFYTCAIDTNNVQREAKKANRRNKQISKVLKQHDDEELKKLKVLLLGTAESGKSTIMKQMKIIHNNGFDRSERIEKIADIKRNIKHAIVVLLTAMNELEIPLAQTENEKSRNNILRQAGNPESHRNQEFLGDVERLWADAGVQECYIRAHQLQLLDCAKYFLDKIPEIKSPSYIPSDQDILRCRSLTTSIQHTKFEVPEGGHQVEFDVYDVGGQQGERKKWIQVFNKANAILFVVDCSSFNQTLCEDPSKNRLLEALENFEQVWNNRFLKNVSVLLFINKIDVLAEKISRGCDISELTKMYPDIFPDFKNFKTLESDVIEFLEAYPKYKFSFVHPDVVKTAVYIKHLFQKIVKGELQIKNRITKHDAEWHSKHSCETFYTCAVDTSSVQKVMNSCRSLIIENHCIRHGLI
ncbi:uncharacterized protein LOC133191341 [Saccostrea echinata]|uniref:uncharacterized protein LOC133191341 n=1 Tax=Saccostrea echinata TaxID=191078 RepID=UPI002A824ED8|nr:uncharacterized protein LOC133191341 [Saccostrea echinata]